MGGVTAAADRATSATGMGASVGNAFNHQSTRALKYDPRSREAPSTSFFNGVGSWVAQERGGKTYIRLYATVLSPERVVLLGATGVSPDSGLIKASSFVPRLSFDME